MEKENVLIKEGNVEHRTGVYAIYYKPDFKEIYLYTGSGDIADCYNRHDSNIKYGRYSGTNKEIIDNLFKQGVKLYFKVITYCSENEKLKIETKLIQEHKETLCNSDRCGKCRSSKPTKEETQRRREANSGVKNPRCRFTEGDIKEIRKLLLLGEHTLKQIAGMYECSPTLIWNIYHNNRWESVQLTELEIKEIELILKEKEAIKVAADITSITKADLQIALA